MKLTSLSTIVSSAVFFLHAAADVALGPFPNVVQPGESYTLNWTAPENYTYDLWLIREKPGGNEYAWSKISSLSAGMVFSSLNGNYTWTVPQNLSEHTNYSLWLAFFIEPPNGALGTNETDWFTVASSTSPATSSTTSSTTSGSPSATSSSVSSGTPSTGHHGLSGGAIAGIVIGCIVAVLLVVGAVVFSGWRRKRSGVKQREAAARANRLAPVMQKGSADYEMHSTAP